MRVAIFKKQNYRNSVTQLRNATRECTSKFATGLKYVNKIDHFFNKWPIFYCKNGILGFFSIENLHKTFGDDISKIMNFLYWFTFGGQCFVF